MWRITDAGNGILRLEQEMPNGSWDTLCFLPADKDQLYDLATTLDLWCAPKGEEE